MGGSSNPFKKNPLKRIEKEIKKGIDKVGPGIGLINPITALPVIIDDEIVDPIEDEKRRIKDELNRRDQEQDQIEDDIDKEKETRDKQASEKGEQARSATRRLARARRRQTILTSGLGVPGEPEVTGKTLLGR